MESWSWGCILQSATLPTCPGNTSTLFVFTRLCTSPSPSPPPAVVVQVLQALRRALQDAQALGPREGD